MSPLFIAILAGLGGMLGWGLADFFAKKTIDQIGDVASLAWGHIFGTLVLIGAALYAYVLRGQKLALPHTGQAWLFLILFGIAQAAVYLFVYNGFGKGQIAVLNPIFASFSGLTAILSIVFFHESVNGFVAVGLATVFFGILLINTDMETLKQKRIGFAKVPGFKEVLLATFLAAFWTLFWDKFVSGQDWLVYALLMYLFMTVVILIVAFFRKIDLKIKISGVWKFLILIGICETGAYLAISLGYSKTPLTSVVALLSGAFSLPTIVLARMFLKEKITALQTAGSLVIIFGLMLIAVL